MYDEIYEGYFEDTSAKDGGVIFQAIVSHDISWKIVDGNTVFDQNNIKTRLHTVEVFPDLNYKKGEASSVYYVLSEVNILKRKFDMASKAIKRLINPTYSAEIDANPSKSIELNQMYFDGTSIDVRFTTDHIVLREVSSSGIDSGNPSIVMKVSTGLADQLDGRPIKAWESFNVSVKGNGIDLKINTGSDPSISKIMEYDQIENRWDQIFQTIIPSVAINFSGDRVEIETFTSRSTNLSSYTSSNIENIFSKDEEATSDESLGGERINN
jgi:hypothetical protein